MNTYVACIRDKWYAFAGDPGRDQVYSIGKDCPPPSVGSRWYAVWTEYGIQYVASPSPSRRAAIAKAKRWGRFEGFL